MTSESPGISPRYLLEVKLKADDLKVKENEIWDIPSGVEVAFRNVKIEGRMRVKGTLEVYGDLDVMGELDVIGEVNVGV